MVDTIKKYIPTLISSTKVNDYQIEKALKKYQERNDELRGKEDLRIKPHCFFDWIILAEAGDKKSRSFLKFIDDQVKELLSRTASKFHPKINSTLKELAFAIETDVNQLNNPVHINFIGEIVGLNHILMLARDSLRLEEIEKKLPNGKKVDFVFYYNELSELLYIDFVSIHNIDIAKLSSSQDLVDFLNGRFNQKLESKTQNLVESSYRIKIDGNKEVNFAILPIIWTEMCELLKFKDAFNAIDEKYVNVFSCCSLLPQELEDESIVYSFCKVRHILDRWGEN